MARPSSATVAELKPRDQDLQGYEAEQPTDGVIEATDLTHGMITGTPRAKRPPGSASSIINGRVRENWVGRRGGYSNYIHRPDTNDVMRHVSFRGEQNINQIVRVSVGGMHRATSTVSWTSMTGTPYTMFQRTDHAQLLGNLYLANPEKKILKLDFAHDSYEEIPHVNAPICRYITAFGDRLLAAYINSPTDGVLPFGLQWSVNSDPTNWSGVGSGSENLIQSPSDTGDEITGIFGFSNIAVIFRERSIWHITRQPFALAPFRFDAIITNQGCNMPWSISRLSDEEGRFTGFIYGDTRTNGIFSYTPGSRPVRLPGSTNIEDRLFTDLSRPSRVVGAFDPQYQEYHLGYPTAGSSTLLDAFRVLSLKNNSIVIDDEPMCTAIDTVTDVGPSVMISDLTGTIDSLTGVIDDISGVFKSNPIIIKANEDAQSLNEDMDTTGTHTFTWESQDLVGVSKRRLLKVMTMAMSASSAGNVTLQWSANGSTWTTLKTITDASDLVQIGFKPQGGVGAMKTAIHWRVTAVAANFKMTEWWAQLMELGVKRTS